MILKVLSLSNDYGSDPSVMITSYKVLCSNLQCICQIWVNNTCVYYHTYTHMYKYTYTHTSTDAQTHTHRFQTGQMLSMTLFGRMA